MVGSRSFLIAYTSLHSERVCLRDFARVPLGGALERFDRARFIEVEHGVKLVPELRPEIVAHALGFWPINDTDSALELAVAQPPERFARHKKAHPPPSERYVARTPLARRRCQ